MAELSLRTAKEQEDDPDHHQERNLRIPEFNESTNAPEASPMGHSGWASMRPTKKVKKMNLSSANLSADC